jgi:biopolymer transport protein ExbD
MARRKMGSGAAEEGGGVHGSDRPWVYFMIDCFFLVTQFFVISFKVRSEEVVLPQKLPPGGSHPLPSPIAPPEPIDVHIMRPDKNAAAIYLVRNQQNDFKAFARALEDVADRPGGADKYRVRVSYEKDVPFEDVMRIFNVCTKIKLQQCGLVPLRNADIPGVR